MTAVEEHEDRLRHRIEAGLAELPGVTVHSRAAAPHADAAAHASPAATRRTPTGSSPSAASTPPPAPSTRWRPPGGSGSATPARLRVGLAPYTDDDDVDRLLDALGEFLADA